MSDLIERQAALDAIMGQPPEPHYPSWYAAQIEKLPAVQPDHVADVSKKVADEDCISRRAAIDAIKTWGLLDGLSEGQAIEILADEKEVATRTTRSIGARRRRVNRTARTAVDSVQ